VGPDVNTIGDKLANINTEISIFMWKLGLQLTSSVECRLMKLLCYVSLLISLVVHERLKLDCIRWLVDFVKFRQLISSVGQEATVVTNMFTSALYMRQLTDFIEFRNLFSSAVM
jgi:hypothetical protein